MIKWVKLVFMLRKGEDISIGLEGKISLIISYHSHTTHKNPRY